MFNVTISRPDLTTEEVAQALRDGLGGDYNVLPGMRLTLAPFGEPEPGTPDTIVVGKSNNRVVRAQVSVSRGPADTVLTISPGGLISDRVLNSLGIARRARTVLTSAPALHASH